MGRKRRGIINAQPADDRPGEGSIIMKNVMLGGTGLSVSQMTLGTWGIGGAGWDDYPDDVRMDAIAAAVESGINFIDTAPAYNAVSA